MRKLPQATKANENQIEQHIRRQRAGVPGLEFAHRHPLADAVLVAALLTSLMVLAAAWTASLANQVGCL